MEDEAGEDSLITSRRVTAVRGRCRNAREECVCLQSSAPAMSRDVSDGDSAHVTHMQLEQ